METLYIDFNDSNFGKKLIFLGNITIRPRTGQFHDFPAMGIYTDVRFIEDQKEEKNISLNCYALTIGI